MTIPDTGAFFDASADFLRVIYGAKVRKKVALAHSVSEETAKKWLADGVPLSRLYRMTAQLRADIARHQAEVEQVQQFIERVEAWRGCGSALPGGSIGEVAASSGSVQGSLVSEVAD